MGKIKKILENELVGGTQSTDVYPVTSTKAVYDTDNIMLDTYIQHLKKTHTFAGVATPLTNPDTLDHRVFYLAWENGNYPGFNGINVNNEVAVLTWSSGKWTKTTINIAEAIAPTLNTKVDLEEFNNTVSDINTNVATKANAQDVTNAIGELHDKIGDRVVVSGNVTNNPDEEDITAEGDTPQTQVLKLKDRAYDSLNASGKGYKILRKNWQLINGERKNVLTQDMINEPNTVYEIRYDFDLDGEEITIRKECVLKFDGGSFRNGTVNFDNTFLTENTKILCKFSGSIANDVLNLSYFVDTAVKEYDCSEAFQSLTDMKKSIYIPDGVFYIKKRITLPQFFTCYGNGNASKIMFTKEDDVLFYYNSDKGVNKPPTINIRNICAIGTYPNYFSSVKTKDITNTSIFLKIDKNTYVYRLNIINCTIESFKIGCDINKAYFCSITNCLFSSLYDALILRESNASSYISNDFKFLFHTGITFFGSGNGINEECTGNSITGNDFSDIGFAGIWILSEFMYSLLAGNYFEKRTREDSENPNSEIIVGDINNEYNLTYTPYLSSCIVRNSGLWAPRGIVLANCGIYNNLLSAHLMIKENVSGKNNSGYTETEEAAAFFSDCLVYDEPYRFGVPEQAFHNVQTINIQNFAIKANSLVRIAYTYPRYISVVSFNSSSSSLRLIVKKAGTEEYYTQNGSEGESNFTLPYLTTPFKYTKGLDTEILIKNTSENNIGASIEIKYLKYK